MKEQINEIGASRYLKKTGEPSGIFGPPDFLLLRGDLFAVITFKVKRKISKNIVISYKCFL